MSSREFLFLVAAQVVAALIAAYLLNHLNRGKS